MAATKLYLGTEDGTLVLEQSNGSWKKGNAALEGKFVEKLEIAPTGRLAAGLPRDGVYIADDVRGPWRRTLEADIRGIGISPHDSSTVFAGTEPASVFRSTDGGESWEELTEVKGLPSYPTWTFPVPPHHPHVRTFDFLTDEPDTVLGGVEVGGVILSRDRGDHWEEYGQGIYEDVHYLLANPSNPDVLYSTTGRGFYRSLDRGKTWEYCNQGMPNTYPHPVVVKPTNADIVYVGAAAGPPPTFGGPEGAAAQIYRSADKGKTWETLCSGLPAKFRGMVRGLVADPRNPDVLYAGNTDGELYATRNGGDHWEKMAQDLPPIWVIRVAES